MRYYSEYCSLLLLVNLSVYVTISISTVIATNNRLFDMQFARRVTGHVYVHFSRLSLEQCFEKCLVRQKCASFNYKTNEQWCELNDIASVGVPLEEISGYVYSQKSNWNTDNLPTHCIACQPSYACDVIGTPDNCRIEECTEPEVPTGYVIHGNTNTVGNSRKYTCANSYTHQGSQPIITCQRDGTWTSRDYLCFIPIVEGWATNVVDYSSQYSDSWGATTILGEPDVYPSYGDLHNAWAPKITGQQDWIEVEFAVSMYVQRIDIYETYNSGGVSSIEVWDGSTYHSVYTGVVQKIEESRIFSPAIQEMNFATNRIRVSIDVSVSSDWVELDAIKMFGRQAT